MRTFLPLAFWYWLYNQLFFFLGALGFFVIHFLVAFIGFGGMDTLASGILLILYALILYKLFGRFLWRLDYAHFRQHLQHLHHHLLLTLLPQISAAGNSLAEAVHAYSCLSGSLHHHYLQHNHYVSA